MSLDSTNIKSRINLYLPSMRPVKEKLSLSTMVLSWLATLALMAGAGYTVNSQYEVVQVELEQAQIEFDVSKAELDILEARHADYKPSPRLMTRLKRLEQELNGKRFLSQHLRGRTTPDEQAYSQVMLDLARLHSDNLWVTNMNFEQDKVHIRGFALDALAVPNWLNGLQKSQYFSGKSFALMNLSNETNENGLIEFEISTVTESLMNTQEQMDTANMLKSAQNKAKAKGGAGD